MAACDAQSPALGMCHMNKHLLTYNIPHYGQQQLNRALQHCRWGNIQQSQQEALHWVTAEWKQSFRKEVSRSRKFLQESQNLHSDFLFSSEVLLLSQWRPSSKDPFTCQIFTVRSLWKKIQINNNAVYQLFFYFSWKKQKQMWVVTTQKPTTMLDCCEWLLGCIYTVANVFKVVAKVLPCICMVVLVVFST